jgi:hypothetical protein
MAVELKFVQEKSNLEPTLRVYATDQNQIFILIEYLDDQDYEKRAVKLDKFTSIKLAKELRKQISFLED